MKIRVRWLIVVGLLCVGSYLGATRIWALRALERGRLEIRAQKWRSARSELLTYLAVFPADEVARLHLAEAFFKDATLDSDRAVSAAIEQLGHIPRDSVHWPSARVQEARMCLFARLQPHRTESLLLEALSADPEGVDAHYMLWKLYDLTGRSYLAEPHFRKALETAPPELRLSRLREWYMSQFYPATANPEIDQMLGLLEPGAKHDAVTELRRLEAFREGEPTAALNHAAVARWYSLEGDPKSALRLLQNALDAADAALQDPFFVATLTQVLFDLGEFDNALKYYRAWPGERSGYEYSRLAGILADEVERDYERALGSYRQAISVWPGQADWRLQFRLARCLAKFGDEVAAESMRQKAKEVELLMEEEIHTPLRRMLGTPAQVESCERMAQFYEQLGLTFEAKHWRDQLNRVQQESDRKTKRQTP